MKPRNHVAAAQQSGAGKHKQKGRSITAMQLALRKALEEAEKITKELAEAVRDYKANETNNVREKTND